MRLASLPAAALGAALSLCACAGARPAAPPGGRAAIARAPASGPLAAEYAALAARARAGDRNVDVARLRVTAGDTVPSHREESERMYDALRARDWDALEKAVDAVLAANYADVGAHHFGRRVARVQGELEREEHHAWLADELFRALRATGDGRTPETAMAAISVEEEYYFAGVSGLTVAKQRLGECRGKPCDVVEMRDERGVATTWYFEISASMGRMQRALEGGAR